MAECCAECGACAGRRRRRENIQHYLTVYAVLFMFVALTAATTYCALEFTDDNGMPTAALGMFVIGSNLWLGTHIVRWTNATDELAELKKEKADER